MSIISFHGLFNERAISLDFLSRLDTKENSDALFLLKNGVSRQTALDSILHTAVEKRDIILTCRALKRGANPNTQDRNGKTALNIAIEKGDEATVDILLQYFGANLESCGYPALFSAIHSHSLDMVKKIIALGADVHHDSRHSDKAIHLAAAFPQTLPILKYFVEKLHCDVNSPGHNNRTPLFNAIYYNDDVPPNVEAVNYLLEHGARADRKDKSRETPYSYARGIVNSRYRYNSLFIPEQKTIEEALGKARRREWKDLFLCCNFGAPLPR